MSDASTKTMDASGQGMRAALGNFAAVGRDQFSSAAKVGRVLLDFYSPLFDAYSGVIKAAVKTVPTTRQCQCEIPETECPPYCVCQMTWEATRSEHLRATIRVTNTGKQQQVFTFQASPFQGPSATDVTPALSESTVTLNPNASAGIIVDVDLNDKFLPGGKYTSQIKFAGQYEQCIELVLTVKPDQIAHCDVEQGEIPTHIHAHRWYHHFQCEEPCFEPVKRDTSNMTGVVMMPENPNAMDVKK